VVSICVSAVEYFTEKQTRTRTTARPRAEDYKAQRRGRAQRRRVVWGSLRLRCTQDAYAHKKTKRSGEAERSGEGGFGGLFDYDLTQHAHAHNKPSEVEKRNSSDCNATQHSTPTLRSENEFKQSQKV
jgi:hypothetical protein